VLKKKARMMMMVALLAAALLGDFARAEDAAAAKCFHEPGSTVREYRQKKKISQCAVVSEVFGVLRRQNFCVWHGLLTSFYSVPFFSLLDTCKSSDQGRCKR
jgi:hypothetical protein